MELFFLVLFCFVLFLEYVIRYFRIKLRDCMIQFSEAGHRLTKKNIGTKNEISLTLLNVFVLFLVSLKKTPTSALERLIGLSDI